MMLKVKIPASVTPRQKELLLEFEKAGQEAAAGGSASSADGTADCKQTLNFQAAWKRLKTFLGQDAPSSTSGSGSSSGAGDQGKKASADSSSK